MNNAELLAAARVIFGDIVAGVEAREGAPWAGETGNIEVDGCELLVTFVNGRTVAFGTSEWGSIYAVKE